jgi:CheY-like chemotaxis protein
MEPMVGILFGDPERLQQVIWNLLSNSIKFTPKDGRIDIELRYIGSDVEITVTDNGAGIEPGFLPFIFNRFAQADSSNSRTHKGLGLGLAIVKHIVELHGGAMEVSSEGKGKGASFIVRLPVRLTPTELSMVGPHHLSADKITFTSCPELGGLRLLVIDDEPDALQMLQLIFEQCHADVRTADTVAEALAIFDEWMPNVLVSDIGMPGQNGYDLIRQIRARGSNIPAVALTAYARVEDRIKVLDAGFQMHVPKPIEPDELINIVVSLTKVIG